MVMSVMVMVVAVIVCPPDLQDNNNPETLVNLVAVSQYLHKAPEVSLSSAF